MPTRIKRRSISKILSKRNESEKNVDSHIVEKMEKLFPELVKNNLVDPARTAIMAAISNVGSYAFGAYDDPPVDGFTDLTVEGNHVRYLKWDWVNMAMEGVLKIQLECAKDLRDADLAWNGKSDPYMVFSADGSCVKSATIRDNTNPVWNSTHYLFLRRKQLKPQKDNQLNISCFDCDKEDCKGLFSMFNKDDLLGSASMPLKPLKKKGETLSFTCTLDHPKVKTKKPSTVTFSTTYISVEDALKEMGKEDGNDCWLHRRELKNSKKWGTLATMTEIGQLDVERLAFIDAPSTGTQAWVKVNNVAKTVVVSFRGTEIGQLKDVLADLNFIPKPLTHMKNCQDMVLKHSSDYLHSKKIRVHSGFQNAYDSVRETIMRIVYDLTEWNEDWAVIITGHSLGGALATLCAFEFENLTHPKLDEQWLRSALRAWTSKGVQSVKAPNFIMMNFGAPRVGNEAFVKVYNATVTESLRVINANDLIHFLPPVMYQHTKFEVLLHKSGEVEINGIDFQSGHTREIRDKIENGELKEEDLIQKAFTGFSILQHLGTYYFELVQTAVKRFKERIAEVEQLKALEADESSKKEIKA